METPRDVSHISTDTPPTIEKETRKDSGVDRTGHAHSRILNSPLRGGSSRSDSEVAPTHSSSRSSDRATKSRRHFYSYAVKPSFDFTQGDQSPIQGKKSRLRSTVSNLILGNNPSFLYFNERRSLLLKSNDDCSPAPSETRDYMERSNSLPDCTFHELTRAHGRSISLPTMHYHPSSSSDQSCLILPNKKYINLHQLYYSTPDWCQYGHFSNQRLEEFRSYMMQKKNIDLPSLHKLSWHGIPTMFRSIVWKCITGYLPHSNISKHPQYLDKKRIEYFQLAYSLGIYPERKPGFDLSLYRQITIDIPRTSPELDLFRVPVIQLMLERVLYCWSIRYPASGYVQGLNDILTPIIFVYLTEYMEWELPCGDDLIVHAEQYITGHADHVYAALLGLDLREEDACQWISSISVLYFSKAKLRISQAQLEQVEADAFWTFLRLLEPIQDNYTAGQCGILRKMDLLRTITDSIDPALAQHFENEGIEFFQFAYRWFNCLLLREVPMMSAIRFWDTCMSEREKGFSEFFVFLLAAILRHFSDRLRRLEFQELLLFLQNLPTNNWHLGSFQRVSLLCSEAHVLRELYKNKDS